MPKILKERTGFEDEIWALTLLLVFSAVLNFYDLRNLPYPIHGDVGEVAELSESLNLTTDWFRPTSWWHLPPGPYIIHKLSFWFDDRLLNARFSTALLGLMANIAMYSLARAQLRPCQALGAVLIIASSPNLLQSYRHGIPDQVTTILLALAFAAVLQRSAREGSVSVHTAVALGILSGASVYFYVSIRPVLAAFWLIVLVSAAMGWLRYPVRRLAFSVLIGCVVAAPLVWFHVMHPEVPVQRPEYTEALRRDLLMDPWTHEWFLRIATRVFKGLSTTFSHSDSFNGDFFFSNTPQPGYFVLFLLAVGAVCSFRQRGEWWPVWGALATALLAQTAIAIATDEQQRFHRYAFVIPLFSLGVFSGYRWLAAKLPRRVVFISTVAAIMFQMWQFVGLHDDEIEWYISSKTRAARWLQQSLSGFSATTEPVHVVCATDPYYNCNNGTFRLLLPSSKRRFDLVNTSPREYLDQPPRSGTTLIIFRPENDDQSREFKGRFPQARPHAYFGPERRLDFWTVIISSREEEK